MQTHNNEDSDAQKPAKLSPIKVLEAFLVSFFSKIIVFLLAIFIVTWIWNYILIDMFQGSVTLPAVTPLQVGALKVFINYWNPWK